MKRCFVSLLTVLCTFIMVNAQSVYVCNGYNYDKFAIENIGDIKFNSTGTKIHIAGETLELVNVDSITFDEPQFPQVKITYNGTTAKVDIPASFTGVTCTSGSSSHVVINSTNTTNEYLYTVEGTSSNGSLTINGDYKMAVMLAGVNLTSGIGAAIDIECGKRIDVIVKENTINTLSDKASGLQKAAFYAKGHVEFKGAGTLNVSGNTKHAIAAKEYIEFKGSLGTVNILKAESDGIHCGAGMKGDADNYFMMNGGNVTISNCKSDCIDSDDYGCINIKGGNLTLNISQFDGCGLKCDSVLTMTGGQVSLNVTGQKVEAIRCSYRAYFNAGTISGDIKANGARGIRGKKITTTSKPDGTVFNGGFLDFNGTNVSLNVSGGTYTTDKTACYGIKADQTLTQTAGDITINVTNAAAKAINAKSDNKIGGTRNGK